nr:hypothetical protein [Tanacetum cinerariifolium]GEZ57514.1 hypothetical protein [Tanacetum cinerariifolium]
MTLTFAKTHNMVAYLTKSDASEWFNQILYFLNGSSIKYALTVNPKIYVSCIKQFQTTVVVKKANDIIRLQALVDKKKVVVTKATIREALYLDNEEGVECLPNEEIFTELARMGYEKPSKKLTFYKAFFLRQWKRVEHLEFDKVAQALDITKLKRRVKKLEKRNKTKEQARKNMMVYLKNVDGFKMDYFKGMSYDDIRPIFKAKFNSNVAFLLKIKEQIEEDENKALKRLNETPVERATKKQKLDEEVEELKRHLQIVPNEDDDVYTEATSLARKVPFVDYQIIEMNNKPYYKILRADDTHQLYVSFLTLLRNVDIEDLEALWSLVKERFSTTKPKNFFDDFLLVTLGAMFKKPDIHA